MPRKTTTKPPAEKANKLPNLLLTVARQKANNYRQTTGPRTWFAAMTERHPTTAKELKQLAADWNAGGETRDLFPTLADFHRFVLANVTRIGRNQFAIWVASLREEANDEAN